MKAEQIVQALRRKFEEEARRLVFWDDPGGEFADFVAEGLAGELGVVKILDRRTQGGFSAKLLLEKEDPEGQCLIYRTGEESETESDWLLDIRLYSAEFHADMASLWLQELGIE